MVTPDSETLLLLLFSNYVYLKDHPGIFFFWRFYSESKTNLDSCKENQFYFIILVVFFSFFLKRNAIVMHMIMNHRKRYH